MGWDPSSPSTTLKLQNGCFLRHALYPAERDTNWYIANGWWRGTPCRTIFLFNSLSFKGLLASSTKSCKSIVFILHALPFGWAHVGICHFGTFWLGICGHLHFIHTWTHASTHELLLMGRNLFSLWIWEYIYARIKTIPCGLWGSWMTNFCKFLAPMPWYYLY